MNNIKRLTVCHHHIHARQSHSGEVFFLLSDLKRATCNNMWNTAYNTVAWETPTAAGVVRLKWISRAEAEDLCPYSILKHLVMLYKRAAKQ